MVPELSRDARHTGVAKTQPWESNGTHETDRLRCAQHERLTSQLMVAQSVAYCCSFPTMIDTDCTMASTADLPFKLAAGRRCRSKVMTSAQWLADQDGIETYLSLCSSRLPALQGSSYAHSLGGLIVPQNSREFRYTMLPVVQGCVVMAMMATSIAEHQVWVGVEMPRAHLTVRIRSCFPLPRK